MLQTASSVHLPVCGLFLMVGLSRLRSAPGISAQRLLHAFDLPGTKLNPGSDGKESACSEGDLGYTPWAGKIPWSRVWQPTSVFLPGESHGQRTESVDSTVCRVAKSWT